MPRNSAPPDAREMPFILTLFVWTTRAASCGKVREEESRLRPKVIVSSKRVALDFKQSLLRAASPFYVRPCYGFSAARSCTHSSELGPQDTIAPVKGKAAWRGGRQRLRGAHRRCETSRGFR